jgi:hypothetical protein
MLVVVGLIAGLIGSVSSLAEAGAASTDRPSKPIGFVAADANCPADDVYGCYDHVNASFDPLYGVLAIDGGVAVRLSWSEPAQPGTQPITGYEIQSCVGVDCRGWSGGSQFTEPSARTFDVGTCRNEQDEKCSYRIRAIAGDTTGKWAKAKFTRPKLRHVKGLVWKVSAPREWTTIDVIFCPRSGPETNCGNPRHWDGNPVYPNPSKFDIATEFGFQADDPQGYLTAQGISDDGRRSALAVRQLVGGPDYLP